MSNKNAFLKQVFRSTSESAVKKYLGEDWTLRDASSDSWSVCFQRNCSSYIHVFHLHLRTKPNSVDITLAVSNDPKVPLPKVWWDDRSKHSNTVGYSTVLWSGKAKYLIEECVSLPNESWSSDFSKEITAFIKRAVLPAHSWYRVAQEYLEQTRDA
ncbi:MAG: hypothetical protein JW806_07850 [Sedimentisphaerales bacterium]|nr:hypothetical protein [Sedimentisphaerales bacterium]